MNIVPSFLLKEPLALPRPRATTPFMKAHRARYKDRKKRQRKAAVALYRTRAKEERNAEPHITPRTRDVYEALHSLTLAEMDLYPGATIAKRLGVSRQRAMILIRKLEQAKLVELDRTNRRRGFQLRIMRHRKGSAIILAAPERLSTDSFSALARQIEEVPPEGKNGQVDSAIASTAGGPEKIGPGDKQTAGESEAVILLRSISSPKGKDQD